MCLVLVPGGFCSPTSETLGLYAFLPVEKSCLSFPALHGLNWNPTSKILYPMIAPRQKLPLQTALAGLGLLRDGSHLPSKCWVCVLFISMEKNRPSPPGTNG